MNLDVSAAPMPVLIALGAFAAVQLALQVTSLIVLARLPRERVASGQKWPWAIAILLLSLVGAIVFLAAGRRPAPAGDAPAPEPAGDGVKRTVQSLYGDRP
ncbi:PLDc_N domain-containing protein [Nonomuraea sp. FMUSA5-5]|uniref:PLDc_N domain-containing protein n=1 Tax=Nonomuraea composti TaxID=2720023 RepID=A0ABX1BTP2_9ACTN|nr:PLDc N-terminal domain-containing protein [Nonomuraea sp. FMUSA5-5]NJP98628.1 PLDc_N domain-containing protein [Nonomuraea sp. FMUSA5-5]